MANGPPGLGIDQAVSIAVREHGVTTTIQARVRSIGERGLLLVPTGDTDVTLAPRTPIAVTYFDRSGLYTFESEVLRHADSGERSMQITPAMRLQRTQRRQYVRLDLNLPVMCLALDEHTAAFEPVTARTGDIGGGGVRLITAGPVAEHARVVVSFVLPRHTAVLAVANVVAVETHHDGTATVRTAFALISEHDRDQIVGFVFDELRDFSSRQ
jgi:c-di-GMP-binding flagellar brake protein YcgR